MCKTILIADDEPEIVELLRVFLERDRFRVLEAADGREAWELMRAHPVDLAILDIMMPYIDGFELIGKIRAEYNIPVIVLSAKNREIDKVKGLSLGADDFISKPFSPIEAMARIHAHIRRSYELNDALAHRGTAQTVLGPLALDHNECVLYKRGDEIPLGPLEYKLLKLFMESPGRIFTKKQLFESVWGEVYMEDDNAVMVQISRLRDKIEDQPRSPEYIVTIKGLGYKLNKKEFIQ
ncbi:MAG: response regulator transcription factor [Paenibacillus dendritiformis]|uniref:response regulator transcription factor n=1 Tax=Paenibacillus dendritiformis TaxID=130049 RepID=UPI001B0EA0C9|nr:response regulator transcription factor [Paenibacillus dendritiformis]MDU5142852.1 response regulator transcription factor [Paenibacillus dendritiformis]GIO73572.1 DNA-binding response regulator [Paenibacillus dendritiformis]